MKDVRLFENDPHYFDQESAIYAFPADEIEKKYSPYGLLYTDDFIPQSAFEKRFGVFVLEDFEARKEDIQYEPGLDEFFKQNEGKYRVSEDLDALLIADEETLRSFMFFANLIEDDGEELVSAGSAFYDPETFEEVNIEDFQDAQTEVYEHWDGSNFKTLELTSENWDTGWSEVTDDYPEWDNKTEFASTHDGQGTGHSSFFYYKDENKEGILVKNVSYFQGSLNSYEFHEKGSSEYDFWAMKYLKELCSNIEGIEYELKQSLITDHSPNLNKGEKLFFDEYELVFSYRDEVYHFDFDEIKADRRFEDPYYADFSELDFDAAVDKAREAIQKRRDERLAELQNERKFSNEFPLDRIFVEREDSLAAGNCRAHTDSFIKELQEQHGFGDNFALRADQLLEIRNDAFTRRAVIQAYRNGHYIHN